jgi:acyl transferase domain-containing protein
VELRRGEIRYISNVTGRWIKEEEQTSSEYWGRQMVERVRMKEGLEEVMRGGGVVMLEAGPGRSMSKVVRMQGREEWSESVIWTMGGGRESERGGGEEEEVAGAQGKLWVKGVEVEWERYYRGEERRRVSAPTYRFQRERYWVEGVRRGEERERAERRPLSDWFYVPLWKQSLSRQKVISANGHKRKEAKKKETSWLLFAGDDQISNRLVERLRLTGRRVVVVGRGPGFRKLDDRHYLIAPGEPLDYQRVVDDLGRPPSRVIHAWSLASSTPAPTPAPAQPHDEFDHH